MSKDAELSKLRTKYITAIYEQKAFLIREEPFTLNHGGKSHLFLNHSEFLSRFDNVELLTSVYIHLLPNGTDDYKLAAVDSIMSPILCGLLAQVTKKDIVVVKEKKTGHGLENKVYGDATGNVVLVDDVTSTGVILLNAAVALREKGAIVRRAVISACRDTTAVEKLRDAGIACEYVATYEMILRELWPTLSAAQKDVVAQEISEKGYEWNLSD